MKWLLLIPVLLILLLWLPVSVRIRYNSRLTVWAGVGPFRVQVYETPEEEAPPQKPQSEQKPPEKPKKKKKSPLTEQVDAQLVLDAAASLPASLARLLRQIHIHHTAVRILTTAAMPRRQPSGQAVPMPLYMASIWHWAGSLQWITPRS